MLRIILLSIVLGLTQSVVSGSLESLPIISGVGGDFTAVDSDGKHFDSAKLRGKVVLLTFGYTNCADICPFTLGYLTRVYDQLTPEEQKELSVLFVTVDPKYDTADHLKSFIGHFNPDFTGLTGSRETIDDIVSVFQATYQAISGGEVVDTKHVRRVEQKDTGSADKDVATLYSHSLTIYLMDRQGFTRSIEYTGTPEPEFAGRIRQLLAETETETVVNDAQIELEDFWVTLPPPVSRSTAAYGVIKNKGTGDDRLIGVSSDAASMVMLHETRQSEGMAKMEHVESLVVGAGDEVILKPMSYHIMFNGLKRKLKKDDKVSISLKFSKSGIKKIDVPVKSSGGSCCSK